MKKALITILLLIATITQAQTFRINTNVPAQFGKYPTLTNSSEIVLSGDTIRAGGLSINLMYILNSINDTNFSINKSQPELFGQRSQVTNNNSLIFGSDTAYSNSISASLIYLLNNNIATTDVSHTFTATQYFNKLFVDTLIANNIDSVHSTYWYSNSGDTIGYIDAATEKVAFFKKMTIGDLQTNTTVAENFIRTNQVQTDTIYPHSPLILAGDSTIAKKLFATSIIIDSSIVPKVNHKLNIGKLDSRVGMIYSDTVITKMIRGYNGFNYFIDSPILMSGRLIFQFSNISTQRMASYGLGQGRGVTIIEGFETCGQTDYQNFFVMNKTNDAAYNYSGIRIGYSADSVGHIESVAKGQYSKRPLVIKADTVYANMYPLSNHSGNVGTATNYFANGYFDNLEISTMLNSPTAKFSLVPVYADNTEAVAGGLTAGQLYKTSTGTLMIVY